MPHHAPLPSAASSIALPDALRRRIGAYSNEIYWGAGRTYVAGSVPVAQSAARKTENLCQPKIAMDLHGDRSAWWGTRKPRRGLLSRGGAY